MAGGPDFAVTRSPELFQGKEYMVEILLAQILEYDVYVLRPDAANGPKTTRTSPEHCGGRRNNERFNHLMAAEETAQAEQDLPDYMLRDFLMKLRRPQDFAGRDDELEKLVEKVTLYDTYGQTGYLVTRVNNTILQKAARNF